MKQYTFKDGFKCVASTIEEAKQKHKVTAGNNKSTEFVIQHIKYRLNNYTEHLPIQPNPIRSFKKVPTRTFNSVSELIKYLNKIFVGKNKWDLNSIFSGGTGFVVICKDDVTCNKDGTSCSDKDLREYDEHKKEIYVGDFYVTISCKITRNMTSDEIQKYFPLKDIK